MLGVFLWENNREKIVFLVNYLSAKEIVRAFIRVCTRTMRDFRFRSTNFGNHSPLAITLCIFDRHVT